MLIKKSSDTCVRASQAVFVEAQRARPGHGEGVGAWNDVTVARLEDGSLAVIGQAAPLGRRQFALGRSRAGHRTQNRHRRKTEKSRERLLA